MDKRIFEIMNEMIIQRDIVPKRTATDKKEDETEENFKQRRKKFSEDLFYDIAAIFTSTLDRILVDEVKFSKKLKGSNRKQKSYELKEYLEMYFVKFGRSYFYAILGNVSCGDLFEDREPMLMDIDPVIEKIVEKNNEMIEHFFGELDEIQERLYTDRSRSRELVSFVLGTVFGFIITIVFGIIGIL